MSVEVRRSTSLAISVAAALLAVMLLPVAAQAQTAEPVPIYFFWSEGCPHCAEAKPVVEAIAERFSDTELRAFEVTHSQDNAALLMQMAEALGVDIIAVPTIVVGEQYWVGFSNSLAAQIETALATCRDNGCPDLGAITVSETGRQAAPGTQASVPLAKTIELPLLGAVNFDDKSLWASTALIAFVDGFNPCSLWVLSILVALTLHTGSRKKVLLIGLVFITVTAGVYALFIAGLFTVLSFAGFADWIRVLVALIALFFGAVNVKDYFYFKEGLSFTIDESGKQQILRGMRRVIEAGESVWGLVAATIVLAVGVSLVEFSCTAGFPVIWTDLVAANAVPALTFALLLLLYLAIYQIDEMAIFLTAVFTLRASRVQERQGRILKLIGGVLMLTLAGVIIINPTLMNGIGSSLIVFAIAFAISGLVLVLHRIVLPKFDIWIGSETAPERKSLF